MKIHICLASDDSFLQHLSVVIASVIKNSSPKNGFVFYILNDNISQKNKKKLSKMENSGCRIKYIQVNKEKFKNCPLLHKWISLVTYYRLSMPSLLPLDIDKVIYLDSDLVVLDDIEKLFNIDIEDYYAAGVQDLRCLPNINSTKIETHVNAGVMLFNLKKMREDKIEEQFFDYINKNYTNVSFFWEQDQTIINKVMENKIKNLNFKWNVQCFKLSPEFQTPESCKALNTPSIIHFRGSQKPWVDNKMPRAQWYFKYLQETPFKEQSNKFI